MIAFVLLHDEDLAFSFVPHRYIAGLEPSVSAIVGIFTSQILPQQGWATDKRSFGPRMSDKVIVVIKEWTLTTSNRRLNPRNTSMMSRGKELVLSDKSGNAAGARRPNHSGDCRRSKSFSGDAKLSWFAMSPSNISLLRTDRSFWAAVRYLRPPRRPRPSVVLIDHRADSH